jgi:hypothetical protein
MIFYKKKRRIKSSKPLINYFIKNLLIIDDSLVDKNIFYKSINSHTISLFYLDNNQIYNLLSKYKSIKRIGIITHGTYNPCNLFINDFTNLIKNINIKYIDLLSCNLLCSNEWVQYLSQFNNIKFGLSKNKVGNPLYGGSWYLDSINKDIKNIYFTNQIDMLTNILTITS